jgi:Flp pilus assembly protein TadG
VLRGDRRAGESGQAAVSFVAVLPLVLLAVAVVVQVALVGHAAWSAANGARAAARAELVGADPASAQRAALPGRLARSAEVRVSGAKASVRLNAPRLLPLLPRIEVGAAAALGPGGADGGA